MLWGGKDREGDVGAAFGGQGAGCQPPTSPPAPPPASRRCLLNSRDFAGPRPGGGGGQLRREGRTLSKGQGGPGPWKEEGRGPHRPSSRPRASASACRLARSPRHHGLERERLAVRVADGAGTRGSCSKPRLWPRNPLPSVSTHGKEHVPLESTSPSRKPAKDAEELAPGRASPPAGLSRGNNSLPCPRPGPLTSAATGQDAGRGRTWISVLRAWVHHAGVKGRVRTCPVGWGEAEMSRLPGPGPCSTGESACRDSVERGSRARELRYEMRPEEARAVTCSEQMVVETAAPSLQGNCPRASSWGGNTGSPGGRLAMDRKAGTGLQTAVQPRRRQTGLGTQGRAPFPVLLLPVTRDPSPAIKLRDLEIVNFSLPGQVERASWGPAGLCSVGSEEDMSGEVQTPEGQDSASSRRTPGPATVPIGPALAGLGGLAGPCQHGQDRTLTHLLCPPPPSQPCIRKTRC